MTISMNGVTRVQSGAVTSSRDRPSSVARARGAYIAVYLVNDPFEPETLPPNWQPPPPPPPTLDDDPPF